MAVFKDGDYEREFQIGEDGIIDDPYERLLYCSNKKDITEWNEWRKKHPDTPVLLQGKNLIGAYLKGADLRYVHLEGANLLMACLESTKLGYAHLQGAKLTSTHLQGAEFYGAHLQEAVFRSAAVDCETIISKCEIDRETDFTGVGLDDVRIDSGLKESLKYNIRRKGWIKWFSREWEQHEQIDTRKAWIMWFCRERRRQHEGSQKKGFKAWILRSLKHPKPLFKWAFVWPFWLISDYGRSTIRIIGTFFALSFVFAVIYWVWGLADPPGVVQNLFEVDNGGAAPESIGCGMAALRSVYFSIVTMTTLGFGDMHARATSVAGYILLMLQVIMGYVLLGALITRLGILFMGEGPPADFTPIKKPKKDKRKK